MLRSGLALLAATGAFLAAEPETGSVPAELPTGTLVYLENGNRLNTVEVETGRHRARTIRALAACGPDMHVVNGRIVFSGVRKGRTTVFSIPLALDRKPTRLGTAHAFVPSARGNAVWLAGTDCDRRRMIGVTETTAGGQVTFSSSRRVPGGWVVGAVDGGLVVQDNRDASVWDPHTARRERVPLRLVAAARGRLVAGCTPGSYCSELTILDTSSGRATTSRLDDGQRISGQAAFSPDVSVLATPVVRRQRWHIGLIDTGSGDVTIIPGSATGRAYPNLSWSASGWLYFRAPKDRVMAYRPGAARAIASGVRLPRGAAVFLAG